MAKKKQGEAPESRTVSARLTVDEIDLLERAAESQSVPVAPSALAAFIIRKWLREWEESQAKGRGHR